MSENQVPQPNTVQQRLIAAASKAAGLSTSYSASHGFVVDGVRPWNPLEVAGDAMRLAEVFIMSFEVTRHGAKAWLGEQVVKESSPTANMYSDLRLAIVKLAAQMGDDDE